MTVTSLPESRRDLKRLCEEAIRKRKPIRIRGSNGGDLVLVAADEFDSLSETAHLLSSPENAARLLAALARARKGEGEPMTLEELREAVGL